METSTLAVLAALLAVGQAGCGSDDDASTAASSGGVAPENAVAHWCERVIPAFCDALFGCCGDATKLAMLWPGGVEECRVDEILDCTDDHDGLQQHVVDGRLSLDEAELGACVSRLEDVVASAPACMRTPEDRLRRCFNAFRGALPGEPCIGIPTDDGIYVECQGGYCGEAGTCIAFPSTGASCAGVGDPCDVTQGGLCVALEGPGTCGVGADEGAPCSKPGSDNYLCYSLTCGTDGLCAPIDDKAMCEIRY